MLPRHLTRTLLLTGATGLAVAAGVTPAHAQGAPKEAVYRCRDARGQTHMGQAIPEVCMSRDIEVLDEAGRVVRRIESQQSAAETAKRRAIEEQRVRDAQASAQRDRTLLATYLTVADIERLRDQRVEQLEQQSRVTRQYITNLRERESRLIADVQRFHPYSDDSNSPPVPDHIAEEIINTVNGLQVY